MQDLVFGDVRVRSAKESAPVHGESHRRIKDLTGTADLYFVHTPDWTLTIADQRWANSDHDVRVFDRGDAPQHFDRLRTRLRLGVLPHLSFPRVSGHRT